MGAGWNGVKTGILAAAAALTLFAGPTHAEDSGKAVIDPDSLPEAKALDRRYQEILRRQPDGKDTHDPWSSVRASDGANKQPAKDKKNPAAGTTATK